MSHFNGPWKPALVLAFLFALCCIDIGRDLWTPDEPREAEISREMQLRPSVIPTLNDERFIEKPPLYYWLVAVAFELTGGPSVIGARAVGVLASWLTLLTVFLWGRREFSETTGLLAAFGLATSTQFLISSHWVLMDPLLMLAMTLAAWLAWKVIAGRDRTRSVLGFYLLLAVALWIKGLIGPVLLASGLLAYAATMRSLSPIRALRPVLGFFLLLAATAVLAGLIGAEGGRSAVREWLWVNHVQRFIDPQGTGHDQPFYYYLVAVPLAVFPWWVPVADCFRPSSWVASSDRGIALRRYLAALAVGMVAILSASATKRATYLLPVLPLLSLLLAEISARRWFHTSNSGSPSAESAIRPALHLQFAMVLLFAVVPSLMAAIYVRQFDRVVIGFLAICFAVAAAGVFCLVHNKRLPALAGVGIGAVVAALGLLVVTVYLAAPQKNMGPFVRWLDARLLRGAPVFATGDLDETFYGIVPFISGRSVQPLTVREIGVLQPSYVLVQDKDGGKTAVTLGPQYQRVRERHFGPSRYFAVWRLTDSEPGGSSTP